MKTNGSGAILAAVPMASSSAQAVMLGQKDTFADGGLSNWGGGSLLSAAANGVDGPTDRFLRVEADVGPPGTLPAVGLAALLARRR